MGDVCQGCGGEFERISMHWSASDCHSPRLSDQQYDTIAGLLMGDGTCTLVSKTPHIECGMITREYLKYLDRMFPLYGQGVSLMKTAEEGANQCKRSGFSPKANSEDYSDVYRWRTKAAEAFTEFRDWYSSGKKIFPQNIELTPTVLKHWYCGDGTFHKDRNIKIASSNEVGNKDKLNKYFTNVGLPEPNRWEDRIHGTNNRVIGTMIWYKEESKEILDYMGEPLPGFEYKWSEEYR